VKGDKDKKGSVGNVNNTSEGRDNKHREDKDNKAREEEEKSSKKSPNKRKRNKQVLSLNSPLDHSLAYRHPAIKQRHRRLKRLYSMIKMISL
jgi:hypothetical protein